MAIPKNITRDHLLKAIDKIDREGVPPSGDSQYYDVIYNGKKYPPKLIVSYANIFANNQELDRNSFSGGLESQCFKLLKENEFIIQRKSVSHYLLGAVWNGNDDQTERFIENGIWENGYQDKFNDIVNVVKVGDRVAIKSSYANRNGKNYLRIKATGTVLENVEDGQTLKIRWDERFTPFDIEGLGAYRSTIHKVSESDIDAIFNSRNEMSYFSELEKFLIQSKTKDLGTANYQNKFQGLTVKVSFGKGNQARVPWISFLNDLDNVQEGIYPVFLYYKEKELLILAYGVSETFKSNRKWNIVNGKSISQYFSENNLGSPERYGNSFVFKAYNTSNSLDKNTIDADLNKLISIYKSTKNQRVESMQFEIHTLYKATSNAGLSISAQILERFTFSLLTKPFLILTGLSGSGKTKLAQAFVKWICEAHSQYSIIPIGADWTNREPLLGYPNALEKSQYIKPDSGALSLILEASKTENQSKPYFLILDEMNLSHVERYFADFLSAMESGEPIPLHNGNENWGDVPPTIALPKNLFIIGTVNIDETTYMFSPKVLDRANVIEFRVTEKEMETYLSGNTTLKLEELEAQGANMAASFLGLANDKDLKPENTSELNAELLKFFKELKKTGAEFGYRSASEIYRFAAVVNRLDPSWEFSQIIDAAVMQKLLPKVHGSRRKLEPVLKALGGLCLNNAEDFENYIKNSSANNGVKYPVSLEKISRMYQALLHNGFTSYAEA